MIARYVIFQRLTASNQLIHMLTILGRMKLGPITPLQKILNIYFYIISAVLRLSNAKHIFENAPLHIFLKVPQSENHKFLFCTNCIHVHILISNVVLILGLKPGLCYEEKSAKLDQSLCHFHNPSE